MAPLPRTWHQQAAPVEPRIIVFSWNLLADALAGCGGFVHAPPGSLEWERADGRGRKQRILAELRAAIGGDQQPDIICLQEVDHFADHLQPALKALGYSGCFEPKRPGRDGLCLFVRDDRWSIDAVEILRYSDVSGRPHGQLALIARLVGRQGLGSLRVATTHLKAKAVPASEALRLRQCRQLKEHLQALQVQDPLPTLLAGDFNAPPDSPEILSLPGGSLGLQSVEPTPGCSVEAWTTWKVRAAGEVQRVIDYIWFGPGLAWLGGLGLPAGSDLPSTGLPCWEYPSDHLHLCHAFGLVSP